MNKIQVEKNTLFIKQKAKTLGFTSCGISKATFLEKQAPRLENWLNQSYNGQMDYMNNHFDMRLDPRKIVEGAKSVISLTLNYFPSEERTGKYKISKYAYGKDYHNVIRKKCKQFVNAIKEEIGDINGRAFTDSAPVMDKVWAEKGGLGWIGKNSNIINKHNGSFFFIAEIICDLELEEDIPTNDHGGTCTKCIDACPTEAITSPYVVNGSKCISYYTIELKEAIPEDVKGKFDNWIFGCDVCQDVCPWNKKSTPHQTSAFELNDDFRNLSDSDMEEITDEVFNSVFKGSPIKRTKIDGFKRNISFVKE